METILSACLLASNSFIQDGKLKLQIMGQRSMEYHDTLENIQEIIIFIKSTIGFIQAAVLLIK